MMWGGAARRAQRLAEWFAPAPPICHIYRVPPAVHDQNKGMSRHSSQQLWSKSRQAATKRRSQPGASELLALELAQAGVQAAGRRLQAGLQRPATGPGTQGAVLGLI
jgi:hypothetical protein